MTTTTDPDLYDFAAAIRRRLYQAVSLNLLPADDAQRLAARPAEDFETGEWTQRLVRLCGEHGVSIDWLVLGDGEPKRSAAA